MPRYREERDRVRVVPGAFKSGDQSTTFLQSGYLLNDVSSSSCLRVYISEEYGYRDWVWFFPGSVEDLIREWKARRIPVGCGDCHYVGEVVGVEWIMPNEIDPSIVGEDEFDHNVFAEAKAERRPILVCSGRFISCVKGIDSFDGEAHIDMEDDSYLKVSGHELRGIRHVTEIIHILDILATL